MVARVRGKQKMNKKLIISLSAIAAVAIIAIGATTAYFSNTEKSTGNTFIAGAIDLKVDNECHYNGNICEAGFWVGSSSYPVPGTACSCTWAPTDLSGQVIFNFTDVKPGDEGEDTISLHVDSNPAWICAEISNVLTAENGCNVPEDIVDETCEPEALGELQDNLYFSLWMDDCDNIYEPGEPEYETYLIENAKVTDLKWPIADSETGGEPIRNACIGVAWSIPDEVGNIIQGDSVTGDITFNAYQARHNDDFVCNPPVITCGNDIVESGEECDDGTSNGVPCTAPYDGSCNYCSTECTIVTLTDGYCGNGIWEQANEVCDGTMSQACTTAGGYAGQQACVNCQWDECVSEEYCGDSITNDAEVCDDGALNGTPNHCNADCSGETSPVCGNNILESGEQCDDGNNTSGDGCDSQCITEYCGDGIVNNGGTEECDDGNTSSEDFCSYPACKKQAKIMVTKTVTNDDGGDLGVENFSLLVDTTGVTSGVPIYVLSGVHYVSETGVFGYIATISGNCAANGDITLAWKDDKSCTITNDDIAPSITLVKSVSGGSAAPDDFDVSIDHVIKTSGSSNPVSANFAHVIDEEATVSDYSFTSPITGSSYLGVPCPTELEGTITLLPGDVVTCTITNTYTPTPN